MRDDSDCARQHNAHHHAVDSGVTERNRPSATGLQQEGASRITELPARIQSKIAVQANGCWLWRAYVDPAGYGQVKHDGRTRCAHIAVREMLLGKHDAENLDHLCRVRHCVNPAHLEPVSHRENMRRGSGFAGKNAAKTHCKRGHEFTAENTITTKRGNRNCRACLRLRVEARFGPRPKRTKLSAAQVADIRARVAAGEPQWREALRHMVTRSYVSMIVRGAARRAA